MSTVISAPDWNAALIFLTVWLPALQTHICWLLPRGWGRASLGILLSELFS